MSRDKQIEEMAEDLSLTYDYVGCDEWHCSGCRYENYSKGYFCERIMQAEKLTAKGYRKADDVAREIFEEIEEMLNLQAKIVCETRDKYRETDEPMLSFIAMLDGRIYSLRVVEEHIAELKKKYTEEGK